MRIINLYFLLCWVIISFISCEEDKYYKIDRDTWFIFNDDDTIIYKNEIANDTFYIKYIQNGYESIDKSVYYEFLEITYGIIYKSYTSENDFYNISREYNSTSLFWSNLKRSLNYKLTPPIIYSIDSKTFKDVYVVENTSVLENDTDIKKVYYTDKYGVIAYELNNGELFEIDVNCLP